VSHLNDRCFDILQKIALLTSIKDEESVIEVFCDVMMGKLDDLQSISVLKLERIFTDTSLKVIFFHERNSTACVCSDLNGSNTLQYRGLNQEIFKHIQDTILENPEINEHQESFGGADFLIKRTNQDKQITFFMAYQFADGVMSPSHNKSDTSLPSDNIISSIQLIRCLSDVYSNQQQLISLNDKDALTGLYNRKFFDFKMNQMSEVKVNHFRRQTENNKHSYLAILDIDHFKNVNDTYGHLYGDEVLLHFSQQMQKVFRDDDCLFRYGGEEFVVILKNVELSKIEIILHRFRRHIESYQFPRVDKVTVSIGVTQIDDFQVRSDLVDRADHALYYIKENGRNNVASYETLVKDGLVNGVVKKDDIELF